MPSPFINNIVLKVGGGEIVVESLLAPMWHLWVAYISIGSILLKLCASIIDDLLYQILLLVRAKWILLHQVLVSRLAPCTLFPQPSNKKLGRLGESWSGLEEPTCRPLVQCVG
jgi:hypothetical protein